MKILIKTATATVLALGVTTANASFIDFIYMSDNGPQYESGWKPLTVEKDGITTTIHAYNGNDEVWAYFDAGTAGLGVCKELVGSYPGNVNTSGGTNVCNPSSDDNVTTDEWLQLAFSEAVDVDLFFNNNHDGGFSSGDLINIGSTAYTAEGAGDYLKVGPTFTLDANQTLAVAFNNEQFYLSGLTVTAQPTVPETGAGIPEPATALLLGLGVAGIGYRQRRNRI